MQLTTIEQHEEVLGKEALELIRIRLEIFKSTIRFSEIGENRLLNYFEKQ